MHWWVKTMQMPAFENEHKVVKHLLKFRREILKQLKDRAEASLQNPINGAEITVPAYFDEAQRQDNT